MSTHKLLLVPTDRSALLDRKKLTNALTAIGLITSKLSINEPQAYQTGESFMQLVTFLGCSPNIQLDPPENRNELTRVCQNGELCHVRLVCGNKTLSFRFNTGALPRCPACNTIDSYWDRHLENWTANPDGVDWECSKCKASSTIEKLNFRKQAAFIRDCIEIWGIYPSEAVPGEKLMKTLSDFTDCDWQAFYIKD